MHSCPKFVSFYQNMYIDESYFNIKQFNMIKWHFTDIALWRGKKYRLLGIIILILQIRPHITETNVYAFSNWHPTYI